MSSLAEIGGELSAGVEIVRGAEVALRALSDRETQAVRRAFPRPQAPLVKDPARGSAAPMVRDEKDPAHLDALEEWNWRIGCAEVAVACGWVDGFDAKRPDAAALAAAADLLSDRLTRLEIKRLWNRVYSLLDSSAQERARAALVVDLGKEKVDLGPELPKLPERYGETRAALKLRVCERFAVDPRAIDDFEPGLMELLIANEVFRQQEESRAAAAMVPKL
jgi:hypothetical protein